MKESGFIKLVLILGVTVVTIGFQNCSQSNEFSGTPQSSTSTSANNGGTTTDNPKPTVDVAMGVFDPEDVQSAELCLSEIKLSNSRPSFLQLFLSSVLPNPLSSHSSSGSSNFSQSLGDQAVTASPSGTYLQPVMIPAGTYNEIEIRLSDKCSNTSIAILNRNGRIAVDDDVTLRFVGSLTITPMDQQLRLHLAPIMSALRNARDADDVEDALDHAEGGL